MELAPAFYLSVEEVAKASSGHDPLPFLISITCKELLCKDINRKSKLPNLFFKFYRR
jgi:hypothetical protein